MKENYTASFLHAMSMKIYDVYGHLIETISYEPRIYPFRYKLPAVEYDLIEIKKKNAPVIKKIASSKRLEQFGVVVIMIPLSRNQIWFPNQRNMLAIVKAGSIEAKTYKLTKFDNRKSHYCEYDEANRAIRLIGPMASPTNEGPWVEVESDGRS